MAERREAWALGHEGLEVEGGGGTERCNLTAVYAERTVEAPHTSLFPTCSAVCLLKGSFSRQSSTNDWNSAEYPSGRVGAGSSMTFGG